VCEIKVGKTTLLNRQHVRVAQQKHTCISFNSLSFADFEHGFILVSLQQSAGQKSATNKCGNSSAMQTIQCKPQGY